MIILLNYVFPKAKTYITHILINMLSLIDELPIEYHQLYKVAKHIEVQIDNPKSCQDNTYSLIHTVVLKTNLYVQNWNVHVEYH